MDNKKRVFLIIVVLALLVVGSSVLYTKMSAGLANQQLSISNEADISDEQDEIVEDASVNNASIPDFKAVDMEGNEIQLYNYLGKPIVLNFWASWCGPCQMEMPDFEEAYKTYGEEVNFLMVNMTDGSRETVEIATEFIHQQGYTFPVYFDIAQEAAYSYGVFSLPTTYFIDAHGYAVAWAKGAINAETLLKGINEIMK